MQPKLELLTEELVSRVLDEAFQLLMKPGIKVLSSQARELLLAAGAQPGSEEQVLCLPEKIVRTALESVPKGFTLYNRSGEACNLAVMPSTLIPARPAYISSIPKPWSTNPPLPPI